VRNCPVAGRAVAKPDSYLRSDSDLGAIQRECLRIGTEKRACVYEYRVNSRVAGDTEPIVS
jgi:hypothetical protein